MQEVSIMDTSGLILSPNKSIRIVDSSALTISPTSIICTDLECDTTACAQQKRPRFVQPEDTDTDACRGILEESQETLAAINLSPNHIYNRRRRCLRQQGSFDKGSLLDKQMPSLFETKKVQGACHRSQPQQLTCNTSASCIKQKKTVRFGDHHDHCSANSLSVLVKVHNIEPISRKYRDQLYWTEPQLLQLQRAAKRVAAHYADHKEKTPYVAAIHRILQSHRSPLSNTSNRSGTNNDTDTPMISSNNTNTAGAGAACYNDVVQVLMESDARGLESRIVPVLKYYRKRTVRAVLELQYQLRMSGELERSDAEMSVHLLRRKSLQASRPCRHLARQLALGDAAAAHIDGPPSSYKRTSSSVFEPIMMPMPMPMPTPSIWLQEAHHSAIVEP
jgi:hypothetical protein